MNTELKNRIEKALNHSVLQESVDNLTVKQQGFAEMLCENIERGEENKFKFYYRPANESAEIIKEMLGKRNLSKPNGTAQYREVNK